MVPLAGSGVYLSLSATTPAEWIESVIRLMDDSTERCRLGCDGRRHVEKHHHWNRALEPLESILRLPDQWDRRKGSRQAAGMDG